MSHQHMNSKLSKPLASHLSNNKLLNGTGQREYSGLDHGIMQDNSCGMQHVMKQTEHIEMCT